MRPFNDWLGDCDLRTILHLTSALAIESRPVNSLTPNLPNLSACFRYVESESNETGLSFLSLYYFCIVLDWIFCSFQFNIL